ncbi:MAG: 2-hydroxyacyl-CoA dehydratase subunit D [Candidatus Heimdallarchaeota archaeon]
MLNILEKYPDALIELRKDDHPLLGYFTNRVPVEILHTLGIIPIRMLTHGSKSQGASDRFIQTFGCEYLRTIMDIGLAEGFEVLDGIIFSTGTCDSLQNVSDIWRKVFPNQWAINLTFPVNVTGNLPLKFLTAEFQRFIETIGQHFKLDYALTSQGDPDLTSSLKIYNKKREILRELATLVSNRKLAYQVFAKYSLMGDIIPVELFISFLQEKLDDESYTAPVQMGSPRLLVAGGMGFDNYRLWQLPEFDHLVADDFSFGTRNFYFQIPPSASFETYVKSYLDRVPDPTAYDLDRRESHLTDLIQKHKIDGVVLLGTKWCDPDAFEFVPLMNILKENGVPYVNIETSSDLENLQQIKTRMRAFIEMLT